MDVNWFVNCHVYAWVAKGYDLIAKTGLFKLNFADYIRLAKDLSDIADRFPQAFEEIVGVPKEQVIGIHRLVGYTDKDVMQFDILKHLREAITSGVNKDTMDGKFLDMFKEGIGQFLTEIEFHNNYSDFKQYLTSRDWVTKGVSSGYKIDGHRVRKFAYADNNTDEDIMKRINDMNSMDMSYALKLDPIKTRIVQSIPVEFNILLGYIYQGFEHSLKQCRFYGGKKTGKQYLELVGRLIDSFSTRHSLPFDYSTFDRQVSMQEKMLILDVLIDKCSKAYNEDLTWLREKLHTIYTNTTCEGIKATAGVWSGELLTSIYDTIASFSYFYVANKLASDWFCSPSIGDWVGLGDDTVAACNHFGDLLVIPSILKDMGIVSRSYRFWMNETEFLNQRFDDKRTQGYLPRAIPSLTSARLEGPEFSHPFTRLTKMLSGLQTVYRRGGNITTFFQNLDFSVMFGGFSKHKLLTYINTASVSNGLGYGKNLILQSALPPLPTLRPDLTVSTKRCALAVEQDNVRRIVEEMNLSYGANVNDFVFKSYQETLTSSVIDERSYSAAVQRIRRRIKDIKVDKAIQYQPPRNVSRYVNMVCRKAAKFVALQDISSLVSMHRPILFGFLLNYGITSVPLLESIILDQKKSDEGFVRCARRILLRLGVPNSAFNRYSWRILRQILVGESPISQIGMASLISAPFQSSVARCTQMIIELYSLRSYTSWNALSFSYLYSRVTDSILANIDRRFIDLSHW
jgi:hypothetical protein